MAERIEQHINGINVTFVFLFSFCTKFKLIMKPLIMCIIIVFCSAVFLKAQKVFTVDYENEDDINIFVVEHENQADLKVFTVKSANQAGGNTGKWFFTEHVNQADRKIYFVKYENLADLKIFFVRRENQAGWLNEAKKYLLD